MGNRKYENVDKMILYMSGLFLSTMAAFAVNILSNMLEEDRISVAQQATLINEIVHIKNDMGIVQVNQDIASTELRTLNTEVVTIKGQVSRMCERQNAYWQDHKVECE